MVATRSERKFEEEPVQKVGRCNAAAVKKAARRLALMYDKALAPTGLKSSQYGILSELNSRGAALPTVHELAEALVMDRSTLGQNLRPLERDELVTQIDERHILAFPAELEVEDPRVERKRFLDIAHFERDVIEAHGARFLGFRHGSLLQTRLFEDIGMPAPRCHLGQPGVITRS